MIATTPSLMHTFEVRFPAVGRDHSSHMVYVRRRLLAGLVFVALLTVLGLSAHSVLADHGGVPASTPVVQPAIASLTAAASGIAPAAPLSPIVAAVVGTPYLVQPGDSLWSIAQIWHGSDSVAGYVERLVDVNGGASLQAGQLLTLP